MDRKIDSHVLTNNIFLIINFKIVAALSTINHGQQKQEAYCKTCTGLVWTGLDWTKKICKTWTGLKKSIFILGWK
jgi:hypothetical protein